MLRIMGSVVIGYLAMALTVFVGLSAAYLVMGADRAFEPGIYQVSTTWILSSIVVNVAAALIGGAVARRIADTPAAPRALAAVAVLLGLGLLAPVVLGGPLPPAPRAGGPGIFEAMQSARTPIFVMLLNPFIAAAGILIGGRAVRTPAASPAVAGPA